MNSNSQETLLRIEQNDAEISELQLVHSNYDGEFHVGLSNYIGRFKSSDASDYSRLGTAIGNNTHLSKLVVALNYEDPLDVANTEFFHGLKRNSSVSDLTLDFNGYILVGGVGHEILKSHQKINNNLIRLCIKHAVLDNGGGNVITETLRWCRHLKIINFGRNNITDEQLLPIVEAIKGGCNTSLEHLYLDSNRIGNAGCEALATLLADTNCNLKHLNLHTNQIGNEGTTAIANSLANNTKLKRLYLQSNPFDQRAVGILCTVLCNTSSVNDTYHSNHTLVELVLPDEQQRQHANLLASLLKMNNGRNKSHVAIKKILKYHPNIDIGPLFEWDADGEQTLKALPYVVGWFERARKATSFYNIDERKLSAIFQFVKTMPLLFVPASNIKEESKKRKLRLV